MKQSKYNFFFQVNETEYIAFNALKNGLAIIDGNIVAKVKGLEPGQAFEAGDQLSTELRKGGFVCEDEFDEYGLLLIRRSMQQYSSGNLSMVIAPTLACNLSCKYCFEKKSDHKGIMDEKVMEGIISFTKRYIDSGIKKIDVTWFGGEPLLVPGVIERLSEKLISLCEENKVNYSSYIITNGTMLSPEIAGNLKKWKVRGAQITIDGDEAVHNQRRPFKNGQGSFDQIIKNVESTAGVLAISIRVNVDNTNMNKALVFFDDLKRKEWFKDHIDTISLHYGYVRNYTDSCRCSKEEILKPGDFWHNELELHRFLSKNNRGFNLYPVLPYGCTATSINAYVVGPEGELYKCWNNLGEFENIVGSIFKPIELNSRYIMYLTENFERDSDCKECKFLPICMGGCADIRVKAKLNNNDSRDCAGWKYYIEDALKEFYLEKIKKD